jgi:hypothetical protein
MENRNRASAVFGIILVALGVIFLAGQFIRIDLGFDLWPFAVIGFGALFFVGMFAGGRSASGLAIPGSIITVIGLNLLIQNTFDIWENWSYTWTLIPLAVGIGLVIQGYYTGTADLRQSGFNLIKIGAILFLVFGAFFELVLGISGRDSVMARTLWPVALILVGIYLLTSRLFFGRKSEDRPVSDDQTNTPLQGS